GYEISRSDQAAHRGIAHAVLAVLDVSGELIFEPRVASHGDGEVVPSPRDLERPSLREAVAGFEHVVRRDVLVPIDDVNVDVVAIVTRKFEADRAALFILKFSNVQSTPI